LAGPAIRNWVGAIVATPAITAVAAPALASTWQTSQAGAPQPALDRSGALKAQLLSLTPDEKLAIAGDRLGKDPTVSTSAPEASGLHGFLLAFVRATQGPPCTNMCNGRVAAAHGSAPLAHTVTLPNCASVAKATCSGSVYCRGPVREARPQRTVHGRGHPARPTASPNAPPVEARPQ
jgi:hypothetical protein